MTAARILALCGLTASVCSMLGGFFNVPALIGAAGAIMLVGNVVVALGGGK